MHAVFAIFHLLPTHIQADTSRTPVSLIGQSNCDEILLFVGNYAQGDIICKLSNLDLHNP